MDDLAHLSVGRGVSGTRPAVGQELAEMDGARIVHRVAEGAAPQRPGKRREQERRGGFVVPYMGAIAEAASLRVVAALEGVKLAVRGAEAGGRGQGGEVRAGRLLDRRRQRAFP